MKTDLFKPQSKRRRGAAPAGAKLKSLSTAETVCSPPESPPEAVFSSERRLRVLLVFDLHWDDSKEMLMGVSRFSDGDWEVTIDVDGAALEDPAWITGNKWDGVITRHASALLCRLCEERGIPLVDLDDQPSPAGLAKVCHDNRAVGHLGAEHFLERGFRFFAFCGIEQSWSETRHAGFQEALQLAGKDCVLYETAYDDFDPDWDDQQQRAIADWLLELPKPLAVMACNDLRALQVTQACRKVGLCVPNEVAVLGVNNDQLRCGFGTPPLSSVATDLQMLGYRGAELLGRLVGEGSMGRGEFILIEPQFVVTRRSTDAFSVGNRLVRAALQIIWEKATTGISASDVANELGLSRYSLERRFKQFVGRSPHDEIRSVRISKIKRLLVDTDLPLKCIAEMVGIPHTEYLNVVFQRDVGMSPGKYRSMHRIAGGTDPLYHDEILEPVAAVG